MSGTSRTDLLLLGPHSLRVQVPVGVQIPSGDSEVFHSNGGAIRQVWKKHKKNMTFFFYNII